MSEEPLNPFPHRGFSPADLARIRSRETVPSDSPRWKSLEELAATDEFQSILHREFPAQASEWKDSFSRRHFLQRMAASLALAGLTACSRPSLEKIVPYVKQPEEVVPGKSLFFASATELRGFATGVLVESREGRPIKIEGNPSHPTSLGATSAFDQAAVLELYDPDRSQAVLHRGEIDSWERFLGALQAALEIQTIKRGAGLRILTETVTSPTFGTQIEALLERFPMAYWHQYDPLGRDSTRAGALLAFGKIVETDYHFEKADVVLSLDSDFLFAHPSSLRYTRHFTNRRRISAGQTRMNRLYAIESSPTVTGSMADHRLALSSRDIEPLARILVRRLIGASAPPLPKNVPEAWLATLVDDLRAHRGRAIVLAGEHQPPLVHALAHQMNDLLAAPGSTVIFRNSPEIRPIHQLESLRQLTREMEGDEVDFLLILGGNPVFTAPADLHFGGALARVKLAVHWSLYGNETSERCHWHLPAAHFLETWGDIRAFDGTVTIQQPLIEPLYAGKSASQVLDALSERPIGSAHDILRNHWRTRQPDSIAFESWWRKALHDGLIPGSELPPQTVRLQFQEDLVPDELTRENGSALELVFRPDPTIWDGRFTNNGWLQELPKPITKITWDNPALISASLAERHGLRSGDVVELRHGERVLRLPVWIQPGQAENSITLHLGYGQWRSGKVGNGTGFHTYALRTSDEFWLGRDISLSKTGEQYPLAATQTHHSLEGRNLLRSASFEEFQLHPDFAREMGEIPERHETLYHPEEFPYKGYAWGMAIDLSVCTGCNACVTACQAENNTPVVGKDQVAMGREMHWLRVDSYYRGEVDDPEIDHQPIPCMHCETAPCEVVCPVAATAHDSEGLNLQIYNRCIGTRYCSNNCPYKVRRFNFLEYNANLRPIERLVQNPEVTLRTRGVMEKCTYCIQRITLGRIEAETAHRRIRDGEVVTACQAACPAEAIIFGDINDPDSRVSRQKASLLNYPLLGELNTRPRTTYLAKLRNPHPLLTESATATRVRKPA